MRGLSAALSSPPFYLSPSLPPMTPPAKHLSIPSELKPAGTSGAQLLAIERKKASFDSKQMAAYLHGKKWLQRDAELVELLQNDPSGAFDKSSWNYLGRTDKFRAALKKDKRLAQLAREHSWTREVEQHAESLCDLPGPFGLHKSMFITTIDSMGTDEQKEEWLGPAMRYEIIGCYAQTELGHGSNVQGLETVAVYDEKTQEFDIHSPSMTASKWWIGGLGRSATHAIVMAQLVLKGKKHGPHPFVVPIRDPVTREPLPGRYIGDIGPKMGYNTTDNGFLLFDHVKVPHFNQLARFAKVEADTAVYVPPQSSALTYGTLTWVRANIVQQSRTVLMRSATVAIRYCAIRRQFADRDHPKYEGNKPIETQVLDYSMVQARIFPVLAKAFAFHYTAKYMFDLYNKNIENINQGDLSLMAETHASTSGLKALCTIEAAEAIETCRRACGGHGYSSASGLGSFYSDYLPQVTWEGDSYMLSQQTSRHLLKQMRAILKNPDDVPKGFISDYINMYFKNKGTQAHASYSGDLYDPMWFVKAFGYRAAHLIEQTLELRDGPSKRSWNSILPELYKCSKAHAQALVVYNFAMAILHDEELNSQPALRTVMQQVFLLYCTHTMELEGAEFLSSGYLTPAQYKLLATKVQECLAWIRPQAVPLVDSFALSDYLLNSHLGSSKGDAYEGLFDHALREPINSSKWNVDINDLDAADIDQSQALPRSKL
ncbi:putative acyl-CoA oxidase [Acaromyces ingoldii]|uniref:Acyl-coenzyme A oxidase n=1 Tax=Acaromyces ingoldii TaxID=215250 RepID=A0A316YN17_9BASI|nr:putative acyl-CoA oxidase [Acaromyces ingoldii]PWN90058.1 putative acyl-CoA oxidase [Acaromyces ingoldii]